MAYYSKAMPGPIYEREGERAIAIVAPDTDRAPTLGSGWAGGPLRIECSSSRWIMDLIDSRAP